MAHLSSCEVRQLLHNKFVVVMGDSVQRAVYKDLVVLLQKDVLLSTSQLKTKGELTFEGDVLLEGGRWGRMHNGTHYREVRQYRAAHHLLRFYFLTRVFSPYAVEVLEELRGGQHAPDVVVVNSCLWDLSRYGRDFRRGYREDLDSLFGLLGQVLPASCLLVWNTAMPVAEVVSGGFLLPEQRLRGAHLRLDVMEANFYSSVAADRHGFDVLDLHFHFRHAGQHRQRDGVHWDQRAHRHLSQLLLAHVADAWGVDLPRRCPVGRWLREETAGGGHAGPAGGRQHRESRGDAGQPALVSRSSLLRTPRRPSATAQPRPLFPSYGQSTFVPSHHSLQPRQFYNSLSTLQVEYTFETSSRLGLEHRLGPIRRVSIQPQSRGSSPYPLQHPSRPRRQRRRHVQEQGLDGQTEN
ncbi:PC-esterase domain-containing protein 1B-like [Myotis lucifugus]|uniref:PC-esterase domain-containing protein 1B-like n=1 Tax=Myotis lucifugus TaxID=59463 RepID=UPI0003C45D0E|nr:PC-esterase domain-containing protein 1B-like [Myotis lucifugus]